MRNLLESCEDQGKRWAERSGQSVQNDPVWQNWMKIRPIVFVTES
jgi:hypothetical protein